MPAAGPKYVEADDIKNIEDAVAVDGCTNLSETWKTLQKFTQDKGIANDGLCDLTAPCNAKMCAKKGGGGCIIA